MTAAFALFTAMLVLALVPGPGVLAVVSRSSTAGLRHGLYTAAGIVTGDWVFITFTLLGLATLSSLLGEVFIFLKYIGAAYLVFLGMKLILTKQVASETPSSPSHSASTSFMLGLLTTLGNPKAILFYLSFFPAFLDLSNITFRDALTIFFVATVAIGGVKLLYAFAAHFARERFFVRTGTTWSKWCIGTLFIGGGVLVATRG